MTEKEIIKAAKEFCEWFEAAVQSSRIYSEGNSSTISKVRKLRRMIEEYETIL